MMPHMARFVLLAILVAGPGSAPLAAQTEAQRILMNAFRDSLDRAADSAGLVRLEARLVQDARRARPDPFDHLRMGFLALRLGELGRLRSFEDAAMEFEAVTRLAPRWPYAWYGLGLAEYALGRVARARSAAGQPEPNPASSYGRAVSAFSRSALADPLFVDVLVEEASLGRRQRQPSRSTIAVEAIRLAATPAGRHPLLLQALGRVEREFGDPKAALHAFDALLRVSTPRSRGLPLLEVARTRFLLGRSDGAAPYYEGASSDDSSAVEGYRMDLAVIASDAELARFDAVRGADRAAFLRRFWGARDASDFRVDGERLQEHYRRLYYARRVFPSYTPTRWRDFTRRVAIADAVDDRGLISIRHGEADDRVVMSTFGFEPNESWRYARSEGDLVVHFVARHAPDDFHLVESLFDVVEAAAPVAEAGADVLAPRDELLLRSREPLSAFYRTSRTEPDRERAFRVAERAMGRASLLTATSTDSYRRRYARPLEARADLALVGATDSQALVRVAIAVPFAATGESWLGEGLTFPLRLRIAVLDREGNVRLTDDTTFRASAVVHRSQRWLAGTVSVPVPAAPIRVRLAVEGDSQEGTVLPFRSLEPDRPSDALTLSELVIAEVGGPWQVTVGAGTLALNPLGGLERGAPAELAFELRGGEGDAVSCQLTVIRTDDNRPGVAYNETWTVAAGSRPVVVRRELRTRQLAPGLYRAELTVSDRQGGLIRRWREFSIR